MTETSFFVAFEGLSGTGKSTIAQQVAERTGATYYYLPPSPFKEARDEIDRHATPEARYYFYLASVFQADREIREILESTPVVCDRFLLTTECWHRTIGVETLGGHNDLPTLLVPNITFLVVCPESERHHRLLKRGLSWNDKQEERDNVSARFLAEYRRHSMVAISNCGSLDSSVEQVLAVLREHSLWRG